MTMLVTLDEMKTYLGIPLVTVTYDDFLNREITTISDSIEGYCNRQFISQGYVQTFYKDDYEELKNREQLFLYHYPVTTINSVKEVEILESGEVETILSASSIRSNPASGKIRKQTLGRKEFWFIDCFEKLVVDYVAGYINIPEPIKSVVYSLVSERYSKENSGIDVNFGSDVQRVSIPGVMSVDFDYSLNANERKQHFGMILGNYANVLDSYRSERSLLPNSIEAYIV